MRSSATISAFAVATATLAACGGGSALSETERRYANACIAASGGDAYRTLCECSSRIVAPKLSEGELTAMEKTSGPPQAWTEEKARAAGFSLMDTGTFGQKKQESFAEMSSTCGGQI